MRSISVPSRKTGKNVITKIAAKKGKTLVYFGEQKIELSINAFTEFRLYEGKQVTNEEKKKILSYSKLDADYAYALGLLARKGYTEMELRQKLIARQCNDENRRKIVNMLKKSGYLDDEEYAKTYVEEALEIKCYGRRRILYELQNKGVNEDILKKLRISAEKEKEASEKAFRTFLNRWHSLPKRKKQEKISQALYERGFEDDVIHHWVQRVPDGDSELEQTRLRREYEKAKLTYSRRYEGYDLKQRLIAALLKKGYPYEDIKNLLEEDLYEND